jgi:F0F1-type ATP synthase gamma subunit
MTKEKRAEPLAVLPPPTEVKVEGTAKEKTASIVEKIIENLEQTYKEEKAKEIQDLYNAFVDAITSQPNPHISNILTALELVKHDVLTQKLEQIRREQGGT